MALALAFVAAGVIAPGRAADIAPREVHGASDAFAFPGVALAWAVLRDSTDAQVVVRIAVDAAHAKVQIVGIDPFTQATRPLTATTVAPGTIELRTPRAGFADWPRTEFRFSASDAASPALVVYYLGVPDTTPEFADPGRLEAYLAARLERAGRDAQGLTR
jgi:hypothetical protein